MILSAKKFLRAFQGEVSDTVPFWFMRQAGRYLPEYKAIRAQATDFLAFCYTPELAVEATLQPIRRFGMDAAIIFSDILVIPDALGVEVAFREGIGPVLTPVHDMQALDQLRIETMTARLSAVYAAITQARQALPAEAALIGFAGSPWTLACYIVEGKGSRDFQTVRQMALEQPEFFTALMELLVQAVILHALAQIKAGADAIQLFDSWSGVLSEAEFAQWVIAPTKRIVTAIRAAAPALPVIGFPRQAGVKAIAYVEETGLDGLSIDAGLPLAWARDQLGQRIILQGNLDPVLLASDLKGSLQQAKKIVATLGDNAFIFNLGHGILPHTPVHHVQALCDYLRVSKHE